MAEILVATTNEIAGYRVVRHVGVARGVVVRSRNIIAGVGAFLQTVRGGNITIYTKLAEDARQDAHDALLAHARQLGANAILALRYDANEINAGVTEVLAYGTAVVVEPLQP
ncbi:MAG: YbjQ family protein [Hyphomicrobiaceae bacterium]